MSTHSALLAQASAAIQTIPSLPLSTFQDSMGINLHMEYTDGKYADASAVLQDLQFIGIRNARDYVPDPVKWQPAAQGVSALEMLAANGIKFDMITDGNASLPVAMQQLDTLAHTYPGMVTSVEGPNEINNFPVIVGGGSNEQNAENFQRAMYSAVHGDSNLKGVPVYYMTGAAPVNLSGTHGVADVANTHPYPHNGEQPFTWLDRDFPTYFTMTGTYPKAITETGYTELPFNTNPGGVDEPAQAELILNAYFDAALQGVSHTYIYQLLDAYPDPQGANSDDHFGFFNLDNSPKVIAYAMRHIADVLPQDKPSPQTTVQAAISGLPGGTGHALALTGSDGSITLFLWNEAPVWNLLGHTLQFVLPLPVKVRMNGSWNVSYFTPAADSTIPVPESNGQYQTYLSSYPTALIFKKK